MSFFNLTQLGADDPIKSCINKELHAGNASSKSNVYQGTKMAQNSSINSSNTNSQANGSYEKYTTMLQKHQRSSKGPSDIYNKPVTTNMKYGWWMRAGVQNEPWTQSERHSCVHSEMTRFVDEMSLTNREFTLF